MRVLMVRRDVDDPLDVGFLLEHLPVILVRADAGGGAVLLLVVRLHDLARDVAAGAAAAVGVVPFAPRGLAEKLPDAVAVAEVLPVDVVLALLVRIDDGDELEILAPDEARIDLPLRL